VRDLPRQGAGGLLYGAIISRQVPNYDDAGRTTAITHKNASGTTLSYYNPAYDNADRITTETWGSGATTGVHSYSYDAASQLTGDGTTTYSYDFNGNRTMSGYVTAAGNRLSTDGVWTYTYDAEGNLIQKTQGSGGSQVTWSYGYDNQNRLVSVKEVTGGTTTAVLVTYAYDVLGNRIEEDKWLSSSGLTTVTRHAYDGQDVWADLDQGGNVLARYVYGDGTDQVWARAIPAGQPNAGVAWYLTDRLGSVHDLMDNTGTIQDHLDYSGYGKVTESNAAFGDRYKFTAREYDYDTGLQYNRARYYDPTTGRWLEEDRTGFCASDTNLYRYVQNDTLNATDPTGLTLAIAGNTIEAGSKEANEVYKQVVPKVLADPTLKAWLNSDEAKQQYGTEGALIAQTITAMERAPVDPYNFRSVDALAQNVSFRINVIKSAYELGKMRRDGALKFSRDPKVALKFTSDAFDPTELDSGDVVTKKKQGIQTKAGVTPSAGMKAIMSADAKNPVVLDCTNASVIAIHQGYRAFAGDKAYDAVFGGRPLVLGASGGATPFLNKGRRLGTAIPGDVVVWSVNQPENQNYAFENTIYLGTNTTTNREKLYFAFPLGILPETDLKTTLLEESKGKSLGNPSIIGLAVP
jgi:RHS repeat-associated protein